MLFLVLDTNEWLKDIREFYAYFILLLLLHWSAINEKLKAINIYNAL